MDDLRIILDRWLNFRGTKRKSLPPEPKEYPVEAEPDYREDEIAFVVGLENAP